MRGCGFPTLTQRNREYLEVYIPNPGLTYRPTVSSRRGEVTTEATNALVKPGHVPGSVGHRLKET